MEGGMGGRAVWREGGMGRDGEVWGWEGLGLVDGLRE